MGRFFIPFADDVEEAERIYAAVRENMTRQGFHLLDRRIERVTYLQDGERHDSVVGQVEQGTGEEVTAIFGLSTSSPRFLVCTARRGVFAGGPIVVGGDDTVAQDFDPEPSGSTGRLG